MRIFIYLLIISFFNIVQATARDPLVLKLTKTVSISDGTDTTVFCAHPALDEESRIIGLMFQETLPEKAGMVFDFGGTQIVNMWMRNTILPLDMIFFDGAGKVVHIAVDTTPFSLDIISSEKPAKFVLEVNAGIAKKYGLTVGDQVVFGDNDCKL
ncbi:MAG: DUF192 domain-containing protein [Lentilitoribacter sp.]